MALLIALVVIYARSEQGRFTRNRMSLRMPVVRYLGAAAAGKVIKNVVVAGGAATLGGLVA